MRKYRFSRWLASMAALALIATACGGGDGDGDTDGGAVGGGDEETGEETEEAPSGSISLLTAISGEEQLAALQALVDAYAEASGNTVEVESSPDFETVVVSRVTGGNPPDVALFPQPGLLATIADRGGAIALDEAGVELPAELVPGMSETGTFDGTTYGVVVKLAIKSLLWYAKDDFDAAGYSVPETWDDMVATTDQMASDMTEAGRAPWCAGIESGGATGWVATDWLEDIMLRLHGPEVYDQWVNHELMFDSPEVREAYEQLEEIWFNEDYVLGGTTGILQTPFIDAAAPMFEDPPGCFFHRQAGFIAGEFEGELGTDYDMAYLPPIDDAVGSPVLFAGDLIAIHTDNPVAAHFVEFAMSTEGQEAWASHEGSGSLAVRSDFDSSVYPSEDLARQGEILSAADFARFDASDLMPGAVGAGAFWSETVAWVSGSQDLDTTLRNIDAAWPS